MMDGTNWMSLSIRLIALDAVSTADSGSQTFKSGYENLQADFNGELALLLVPHFNSVR